MLEPLSPPEVVEPSPAPRPSLLQRLAPGLDRQTLVVIVGMLFMLLVSHYEGSTGWFNGNLRGRYPKASNQALEVASHVWWFGTSVLLYLILPCALALIARAPRSASWAPAPATGASA